MAKLIILFECGTDDSASPHEIALLSYKSAPARKLQITDAQGRNVTSFALKAEQGQQLWDIREVKKGTYFYILKAGNQSKSGKLIIH
ncbi:MAG: T9SS type A sorting domain-containing protein [Bacteroidales bacterium]|nr:T9SS type A sorting domain-containing protein [Bacteroidales bacterium]